MRSKKIFSLLVFIVSCLVVGWLGSISTESSRTTWYPTLQKPPMNPPDWVFAPVWTTLYIFIAIAGWRIWSSGSAEIKALKPLFIWQLILNGAWSFLFFGLRSPWIALIDIGILEACLFILVGSAWRKDRYTAFLLLPYFLWVSFATYLNSAIWWLNR